MVQEKTKLEMIKKMGNFIYEAARKEDCDFHTISPATEPRPNAILL